MLHDALHSYLEEIESAVHALEEVYIEVYEEEILTPERVNLRIRVRFYNGCLLEMNESVIYEDSLKHLGYRYHFQGKQNQLFFRYDNTPHFRNLSTFPNHKHYPAEVVISERPSIIEVLKEAVETSSLQKTK
jgi:hypothetical protein